MSSSSPYASRLPLPTAPTTPLHIPYTRIDPPSLPVSRVLFPTNLTAAAMRNRYREHPGLSRIPRLAQMPETPTPPAGGRGRRVASAPGGLRMRREEAGGWRVDGRVKVVEKRMDVGGTWPVAEFGGLAVGEKKVEVEEEEMEVEEEEEEEGKEEVAEEVVGAAGPVVDGGARRRRGVGFRRLVKRIRRSFSKVTLKRRE